MENTNPLTTTRQRVNARAYATEGDARAAIMEYEQSHPDSSYHLPEYRGEGFYVLVSGDAAGSRWLTGGAYYGPQPWEKS